MNTHPKMSFAHTSGPYEVAGGSAGHDPLRIRTLGEDAVVIALLPTNNADWFVPLRLEEIRANADLLASATDLHAACVELIHGDGSAASLQRTIELARIALGLDKRPTNS